MIKKMICFLFSLMSMGYAANNSFAFQAGHQEVNVTVTNSYVSRYIWRGQDVYADNDAAYQPSVDISLPGFLRGTDVDFNVWGSFPLSKGHELADELDYTLSFSRDLSDLYNLSLGYTYYDYPKANKYSDIQEPWVSFTFNKIPYLPLDVSFNIFAGYDFAVSSGGPEEGWYYSWGLSTELPLPECSFTQNGQSLSLGITNWGQDGVAGLKPSSLYAAEINLSTAYTVGKFGIAPKLSYTINYEEGINNGNEELYGGVDVSCVF